MAGKEHALICKDVEQQCYFEMDTCVTAHQIVAMNPKRNNFALPLQEHGSFQTIDEQDANHCSAFSSFIGV